MACSTPESRTLAARSENSFDSVAGRPNSLTSNAPDTPKRSVSVEDMSALSAIRRLAALSRRRMALNADMSSTLTERFGVSGALLVKLFGRPATESKEFSDRAAKVRDSGVEHAILGRVYYGALALGGALGTAAVYWLGGHAVIDGSIMVGTLTALAAYVARLYSPLTDLASARVDLLTALVSFDRVFEVLDA